MVKRKAKTPEFSDGNVVHQRDVAGLTMGEILYAPNRTRAPHAHENACLHFLFRGGYVECQGGRSHDCQPSTLSFQPAGHEHSYRSYDAVSQVLTIEFSPAWLERVREYGVKLHHAINLRSALMQWIVHRLRREFSAWEADSALVMEGLTLELAVEVSRHRPLPPDLRRPPWLTRTMDFLRAHFMDSLTLTEIAHLAQVHPVHLARVFRRQCRCTVGEYVRQLRIEFACRQIVEDRNNLIEIALACGFSDQSQFSRSFKRVMGSTPAEFRAASRTR